MHWTLHIILQKEDRFRRKPDELQWNEAHRNIQECASLTPCLPQEQMHIDGLLNITWEINII